MEILDIIKVIVPTTLSFFVGIAITPTITNFLYKHEMWKKKAGKVAVTGEATPIYDKLYEKRDVGTPRMGGTVIWLSVFIVGALIWTLSRFTDTGLFDKIEFVSRNQTWIPFWALLIGALVGLLDDWLEIKGSRNHVAGGLSLKLRLCIVAMIGIFVGLWFFTKLDVVAIGVPFLGMITVGWLIVPFYVVIMLAVYAGGVIDGLDGLSGGVFASIFAAYGIYAFSLGQLDLAAFCGLLVGSILAFLWFNIPPARFYMSETGSMALTITVSILAFMTDSLAGGMGIGILPIVAILLFATAASSLLQVLSKKLRGGKKIFLAAPLHHHFEAIGWSQYKIVMRYWVLAVIFAALGLLVAFVG
ncbi:MAG: phospho-N-acetylmuramoyl-pentapeptide-transferase, phospho-N-acetylmuramoyl-pentapeptide-transferase [Candidatus Parcubacteria bacterium]|jgi:phospho-N-acetylmuramoyl-pentapeptide-transferase